MAQRRKGNSLYFNSDFCSSDTVQINGYRCAKILGATILSDIDDGIISDCLTNTTISLAWGIAIKNFTSPFDE